MSSNTPVHSSPHPYDVAITGGGLAGLALSIQLARAGYNVAVYEKETYPFHKVCGEYISLESWNFLEDLGLPLSDWNLPLINRLLVSAPDGNCIEHELAQGGFGISRFKIDDALATLAKNAGVDVFENTKVTDMVFNRVGFSISSGSRNDRATIACGSFGKRSNLDVKWNRSFARKKKGELNNYVGVKYHVKTNLPDNMIGLHNFKNGYCGISKIEDNKYCLCYLTTAKNLKRCGNSIKNMEQQILCQNPFLKQLFTDARILFGQPLTISQISFSKKTQVHDHVLLLGDAAGMITPLCGNGMSMALHGAKLAFEQIQSFLAGHISRYEMEQQYADNWNSRFGNRLLAGRAIQYFFGNPLLSNFLLNTLKPFPKLVSYLIRQTHGTPY